MALPTTFARITTPIKISFNSIFNVSSSNNCFLPKIDCPSKRTSEYERAFRAYMYACFYVV